MNILILGPPGAGKGTQSQYLESSYGYHQLSTGDLVRSQIALGSDIGIKIKSIVESGKLPDTYIINDLVSNEVKKYASSAGIIFDGYPRTKEQITFLDELLEELKQNLDLVISLQVPDHVLISRIVGRQICGDCKTVYHPQTNPTKKPGVCDLCGSCELKTRKDDTKEVLEQRLEVYKRETKPVLDHYSAKGVVFTIDGTKTVEEISKTLDALVSDVRDKLHSARC